MEALSRTERERIGDAMDGFLLLVRKPGETWDVERTARQVRQSIEQIAEGQPVTVITEPELVFAYVQASFASDAHVRTQPALTYIQGYAARLTPNTPTMTATSILDDVSDALTSPAAARALAELSGSFCAVFHDGQQTAVVLDRLLSRPVFTTTTPDAYCFASDLRTLLPLPGVNTSLDDEAVVQFMRTEMIWEDRTLYRDIQVMPAASCWRFNHATGDASTQIYWQIERLSPYKTLDEAIDAHVDAFVTAMGRIIAGYEKLSLFLSGGMDSRILAGSLLKHLAPTDLTAHTFQLGDNFEARVAGQVAQALGIPWFIVNQSIASYWRSLPDNLSFGSGLYSFYHTHTHYTAQNVAAQGYDMAIEGWGLDLLYSGSYFPRRDRRFLNRALVSFELDVPSTPAQTLDYLHGAVDRHAGQFTNSLLVDDARPIWEQSTREALERLLKRSQTLSDDPLDWIDTLFFGFGVVKFRSYPMALGIRRHLRQRNPMFESDVIEVFQRTPSRWRFQGKAYRRALLKISEPLTRISYVNTRTSPLAPLWMQSVGSNTYLMGEALATRARRAGHTLGLLTKFNPIIGNYPHAAQLSADVFIDGGRYIETFLDNVLIDQGLVARSKIETLFERLRTGLPIASETFLAYASLCVWLKEAAHS